MGSPANAQTQIGIQDGGEIVCIDYPPAAENELEEEEVAAPEDVEEVTELFAGL
jgi:hypothetical protein